MAIQFPDMNPGGPGPLSNDKSVHTKVARLLFGNFTTTNTDTLIAVLPADATIINLRLWVKTALAGGSVASPLLSLGNVSGGAQFMAANAAAAGTAGVNAILTPILAIMQPYGLPLGSDIQVWARGGCSTGNPTSGEMYVTIEYVR